MFYFKVIFISCLLILGLEAVPIQEFYTTVAPDTKIRAVYLKNKKTTKEPKIVFIYFPGRAAFFEKGQDFLQILAGQNPFLDRTKTLKSPFPHLGSDLWCLEYRAHGKSDGRLPSPGQEKGHITDFKTYLEDLHEVLTKTIYPHYPSNTRFVFIGLSLGGQLALQYLETYKNEPVEQLILMAPMLLFKTDPWPIGLAKNLSCLMSALGFSKEYAIGYGNYNPAAQKFMKWKTHHSIEAFTQDTTLLLEHPELRTGGPTFAWVCAAFRAIESTMDPQKLKSIHIP